MDFRILQFIMKKIDGIGLKDVQSVYGEAEGDLWELVMGQQIHIGGFNSSLAFGGAMVFMQELAHAGKISQGCFVARKIKK